MKKFKLNSFSNLIKTNLKNKDLLKLLDKMYYIRLVESKLAEEKKKLILLDLYIYALAKKLFLSV